MACSQLICGYLSSSAPKPSLRRSRLAPPPRPPTLAGWRQRSCVGSGPPSRPTSSPLASSCACHEAMPPRVPATATLQLCAARRTAWQQQQQHFHLIQQCAARLRGASARADGSPAPLCRWSPCRWEVLTWQVPWTNVGPWQVGRRPARADSRCAKPARARLAARRVLPVKPVCLRTPAVRGFLSLVSKL